MDIYDIVFIGHLGTGAIVPFEGPPFEEPGSPVLFSSIAAASLGRRIAVLTRYPGGDESFLDPLRTAGIDLFLLPGEIVRYRVVFPSTDIDQRRPFLISGSEPFMISDIPAIEPCVVHLCCVGEQEFQLDLMRALKARGFRLSVDMQSFVLQADLETGAVRFVDVPDKKEILAMADFVKLDTAEARTLTGSDSFKDQVETLEDWGSSETILTSSEGVLARSKGRTVFAKFTNRSSAGRMGRGDTVMGSYLARRLDYSIEESLRFAAALASIKVESRGPFTGSTDDVVKRMEEAW